MGITNGQPVDEQYTNPAFLDRRVDDVAFGRYTLQNTTDPTSGAVVANIQQHINDLMQNGKLFLHTQTHMKVSYLSGVLTVPEPLEIESPDFGVLDTILGGTFALADGESLYVTLSRYLSDTLTPHITALLPKGKDILRVCTRIANAVIFFDGSLLMDGASGRIGQIGGELSEVSEVPTHVSGLTWSLTGAPITQSFKVFIDGRKIEKSLVTLATPTFTLDSEVEFDLASMNIEVVYLIEGGSASPTPGTNPAPYYRTITSGDITAKGFTLPFTPDVPARVVFDIPAGAPQIYGDDFIVTGTTLSWDGYALDGTIAAGMKVRVLYI